MLTKKCNQPIVFVSVCKKLFTRLFLVRCFQFREHSAIITRRPLQFIPGAIGRECNQVLASLIRVVCVILRYPRVKV